jgi:hypothetical protein
MISGLLASTLLTLMVVPALYRVLMSPLKTVMPGWMAAAASAIAMPAALFRRKNRM